MKIIIKVLYAQGMNNTDEWNKKMSEIAIVSPIYIIFHIVL